MKRILFLTGTRADFGKLKPLIRVVQESPEYDYEIFCTGMHLMSRYGSTVNEVYRAGFDRVFRYMNQVEGEDMEITLANTIVGLSRYLHENHFDLIVVHGDRPEALAGATVGAMRNILVAHIEGGEISGTVDELMRHSISKLSHVHFVANEQARNRLIQLGERDDSIFVIGSPDIDIMLSNDLPELAEARRRYDIPFDSYAIAMLHPVTTEREKQRDHADIFVSALNESDKNFVVIYPNNDTGSDDILEAYDGLRENPRIRLFPSLRFEHFLTLLRNAEFIIGNSSAGIHEAPVYGIPTINIGNRQFNRFKHTSIVDAPFRLKPLLAAMDSIDLKAGGPGTDHFGSGNSAVSFLEALNAQVWSIPNQKVFRDLMGNHV